MQTPAKPWLSKEVSVQWIVGLVLAFAGWAYSEKERSTREMAELRSAIEQQPRNAERRDRMDDKLQACLERQIDLALRCPRARD